MLNHTEMDSPCQSDYSQVDLHAVFPLLNPPIIQTHPCHRFTLFLSDTHHSVPCYLHSWYLHTRAPREKTPHLIHYARSAALACIPFQARRHITCSSSTAIILGPERASPAESYPINEALSPMPNLITETTCSYSLSFARVSII